MEESIQLAFKEGASDKIYQAELKEKQDGWHVEFGYGRRGASLIYGTKTKAGIAYDVAKITYDKLVKSKVKKGYNQDGGVPSLNAVSSNVDSGIRPQLLNELTEEDAEIFINDDDYCMQEKFDGRRRLIKKLSAHIPSVGINKKGIEVALSKDIQDAADNLGGPFILDGEDMGDEVMCFDDLSVPELTYRERYSGLLALGNVHLKLVKTAWTSVHKRQMFDRLKLERAEGVVFKNINAPYSPGRPASGGNQFKCKFYETASCIVSSVSNVKNSIGLKVYDDKHSVTLVGVPIGNATLYPNSPKVKVGDIVEIKYLYYNEGGSLIQPVLLSLRDDVYEKECLLKKLKRKKDE
jgi:bifunctional non-homologous end joining protein LigD